MGSTDRCINRMRIWLPTPIPLPSAAFLLCCRCSLPFVDRCWLTCSVHPTGGAAIRSVTHSFIRVAWRVVV